MRIQHNIPAMNSLTNYTRNNNALAGNLEKLSSGYRINSAADDAAGLAISEKMRSQIKGLEKAYDNANDGISLVQTAEGALTEVNSMLTRLTELATQSANGTYQDDVDREAIQEETNSLLEEIDRISDATNFNGIDLLNGNLGGGGVSGNSFAVSYNGTNTITLDVAAKKSSTTFANTPNPTIAAGDKVTVAIAMGDGSTKELKFDIVANGSNFDLVYGDDAADKVTSGSGQASAAEWGNAIKAALEKDETFKEAYTITGGANMKIEANEDGASTVPALSITTYVNGKAVGVAAPGTNAGDFVAGADKSVGIDFTQMAAFDGTNADEAIFEINGEKFAFVKDTASIAKLDSDVNYVNAGKANLAATDGAIAGNMIDLINQKLGTNISKTPSTANTVQYTLGPINSNSKSNGGLVLQIGDTNDEFNKVTVSIDDMGADALGLRNATVDGVKTLNLSNQDTAGDAIKTIKDAVNKVSAQRGKLGALQNRLDHTLNNLDATTENITSSESQIRDVNMAKEMTAYTKNNILAQAAQSMLAQANSMPQGVLQLLQ